ncbi:winged helix-turn-helix domain-containing protein [Streptomonospora wellingtoniae]|uniref:Transcriptional regulator n=1 Tax=Streptomonospora wellingtoniae TaxID=3075544 RepID=A0ABU2KW39_9ACTN|nr:transcriptional regulator [Streptomonospora sp. DSM 45055]MDT0303477.1 transcriptional regulator [Streptomonospora sp. DSM 45055]
MTHPRKSLDDVVHSPVRFSVMAALAAVDQAGFQSVRTTVEISESALSKQVSVLESAGYVAVHKVFVGKRPRTYLALTQEGRDAFQHHLEALRAIVDGPPASG